jgi:predicted ATPase/class 3 adenylate cyclase
MIGLLTDSELERLKSYMPPGWREKIGPSPTSDEAMGYVLYLQKLLSATGTYIPRTILIDDHELHAERGVFRHGTALFADVSGFSTLTERFSQELGREGAEEMTLIVNRFLEAVNNIAIQYGGDLLKFAGDASISFYRGADHAARACRAAWEMQQTMQERFACVKTSLGEFPLRMSIGLGSGQVFIANLGTADNAECAAIGPALANMGHAEHLAKAGQIFIDQATRDLAGETISATPSGDEGFFELCDSAPHASTVERPDPDLTPPEGSTQAKLRWLLARLDKLTAYLPPGLLGKLIPSPTRVGVESDHRWVTTVFADLRGANDLVEALGPKQKQPLVEAINCYFLAMHTVVERYEGVLHKISIGPTGPHLFITFGAPKSHPDDPERAVHAALEMQEALVMVNQDIEKLVGDAPGLPRPIFRQAVGITTGFAFAGSIGSARRWEYTVMSDLVNLAARLMATADDGEILVDDSAVRYLSHQFELHPRPPIQVKGKREPVSYAQVTGLSRLPASLRAAEGELVGREVEIGTAQHLLDDAIQSKGSLLVIRGEAGMGKTRLTQEIAREAQRRGMRAIAGACLSYGGDIPYLPWADVLRALLGITATERTAQIRQLAEGMAAAGLMGWEPLVAEMLDLEIDETELTASLDARLRQQRLFDIVLELIQRQAQAQPLLLALEDVHWSDPTSLELLDYVGRNISPRAATILILHRPREWLDDRWNKLSHATEIVLQELPATAVKGLLVDLLDTDEVPDRLVSLVLRKAQGNPFFTEEVVHALIDADALRKNGHWRLVADPEKAGVPDTIHGVIQSRIDRLEETDRRVLQVASVIGRVFDIDVLSGVYPYDDVNGSLPRRLGRLGSLGLVLLETPVPEPHYMFKHALTQDVAYESLPYARRREIHRHVGTFVATQGGEVIAERPGFLAHHFFQGQAWLEALTYSLVAGRKAQREYANEAAISHFERALQAAARSAKESTKSCAEEQLEAHEALGEVLTITGHYDKAQEHLEQARTLIEARPSSRKRNRKLAGLLDKMAAVYEAKGDYDAALEQLTIGLTQPDIQGLVESANLYLRGVSVLTRQANYDKAQTWCERALEISKKVQDRSGQETLARGHYFLGGILMRRGDVENAIKQCQTSLTLYNKLDDLIGQAQARTNLAAAFDDLDRWEEAARHYRIAMDLVQQIGYAEGQARVASNLGEVYLAQGHLKAAEEQYKLSLAVVERLGMRYGVALLHNNLGSVYVREKNWTEAEKNLEHSLRLFQEIGSEEFLTELFRHKAEAALGQNHLDEALACIERSINYAQVYSMRLEEGMSQRVLGQIHRQFKDLNQTEEALTQAMEIAQETRKRHESAMIHLELARLRLQQGKESESRELAQKATQVFAELGARLDLEEAEKLLQQIQG